MRGAGRRRHGACVGPATPVRGRRRPRLLSGPSTRQRGLSMRIPCHGSRYPSEAVNAGIRGRSMAPGLHLVPSPRAATGIRSRVYESSAHPVIEGQSRPDRRPAGGTTRSYRGASPFRVKAHDRSRTRPLPGNSTRGRKAGHPHDSRLLATMGVGANHGVSNPRLKPYA